MFVPPAHALRVIPNYERKVSQNNVLSGFLYLSDNPVSQASMAEQRNGCNKSGELSWLFRICKK